jgi:exopolysaccharide biosynthesis WecB/TagA/CpsF family protein
LAALRQSLLGAARPASFLWPHTENASPRVTLFGIAIENTRLETAARELAKAARDGQRTRVVFANAHAINCTQDDPGYKATVATADRVYADGSGMALAARIIGAPPCDNVNGTDLFPLLCREAIAAGTTIFLLGGKPGVAAKAAATIAEFGMGAAIAGTHHGYFERGSAAEDRVIGQINASGAGIVLVGFGVPLQDQWVQCHAARLDAPVVAGVGGLFDFFSGAVSRSPKAMRSIGCEWMWRLAMEPRRMAHRYLVGNLVFIGHAVSDGLAKRRKSRARKLANRPAEV